MADAFERELLTDIAEAEAIGEVDLAAEWRWELKTYRAARKQAILNEQARGGSSAVAGERRSGSGGRTSRELTDAPQALRTACRPRLPVAQGSQGVEGRLRGLSDVGGLGAQSLAAGAGPVAMGTSSAQAWPVSGPPRRPIAKVGYPRSSSFIHLR